VPAVIEAGLADMLADGAGVVLETDTVTDFVAERDPFWHVNENVLVAVTANVCWPWVGFAPDHSPAAVHDVARAADQLRTVELPCVTLVGDAEKLRDMDGAGKAEGASSSRAASTGMRR